ncbi:zinc finger protein 62 homolog [Culicoides brevitarsis]|uniref:zinc finger protein 62 homolog n=1 Tax=Culicoides brevitarsis TaxID=469753 RepID=UPI00307BE1F4
MDCKYEFCRICFQCTPDLLDLNSFLPVIRLLAQTKIPCEDEKSSKICSSCANCVIMANLFRMKVIDSNGRYRELLKIDLIKREAEDEETLDNIELENSEIIEERSIRYDEQEQVAENYMQVEFLQEDDATDEEANQIIEQFEKIPLKKELEKDEKTKVPQKNQTKNRNTKSCNFFSQFENFSEPICFICTEPALKKNSFSPYKDTLNRIVPVHHCGDVDYVCQKCMKKLDDSKGFFAKLDKVKKITIKSNCCQFCSSKVSQSKKTSNKNSIDVFNSLHNSGYNVTIEENATICSNCVQLLTRIRILRNSYNAKEKYLAKQLNKNKGRTPTKKRPRKSKAANDQSENYEGMTDSETTLLEPSPKRRAKRRLRIKSNPKYVEPDPNEPVPEDYQCHMSDFEEIESDTDIPEAPFRSPLNVPFQHKYLNCPECSMKFVNSCEMDLHIEIVHGTTDDVCNICHKAFKDVKTVKEHKISCHTADFSAFNFRKLCDICGLAKRKFDNHYVIHFDVRAFKCQLCSCDYKTKASLEDHIRTVHMGEKRHKCSYCDKRFSYAADKARHEIGVHTKKFKYICQFCGKCFLKKNFLTTHQKSQHAEMLLQSLKEEADI